LCAFASHLALALTLARAPAILRRAGMLAGSLVSGKSISEQTYDWLGLPFN